MYMLKLHALIINGKNETALYRQWYCYIEVPFKADLTVVVNNICIITDDTHVEIIDDLKRRIKEVEADLEVSLWSCHNLQLFIPMIF